MKAATMSGQSSDCQGKEQYASVGRAFTVMRRRAKKHVGSLKVYRCAWCNTFHIGHGPSRVVNRKREAMEAAR